MFLIKGWIETNYKYAKGEGIGIALPHKWKGNKMFFSYLTQF